MTERNVALDRDCQKASQEAFVLRAKLSEAERQASSEHEKYNKLDKTVEALHRMNENAEAQAINGYKADLASALQSIVRDARLPEVQGNAEMLSAIWDDLLDTLRLKGIMLEEEER